MESICGNFRTEVFYVLEIERVFRGLEHLPLQAHYTSEDQCFESVNNYLSSLSENELEKLINRLTRLHVPIKNVSWRYVESILEHYDDDGDYYSKVNAYIAIKYDIKKIETKKDILGADGITYKCYVEEDKANEGLYIVDIVDMVFVFCEI